MLSLTRALNLGTSRCLTVLVPNPVSGTIDTYLGFPLHFSHPMASAVTLRRQLAPTVGQSEASTGVLIRTGPSSSSSVRFATGLVLRVGAVDFVTDNASRFGVGAPLPCGIILPFGSHRVFVASLLDEYPSVTPRVSCNSNPFC